MYTVIHLVIIEGPPVYGTIGRIVMKKQKYRNKKVKQ